MSESIQRNSPRTSRGAFVALLRGINVSGRKTIRMAALRESCERLGWQAVQSYLQSGNIVFRARRGTPSELAAGLAARIVADFGHEVEVLVLRAEELCRLAAANPLRPASGGEERLYHATFLFRPVPASVFRKLDLPAARGERAILQGQAVLLYCPHGYGRTKLNNGFFEKAFGLAATTRNWRTVLALRDLSAAALPA